MTLVLYTNLKRKENIPLESEKKLEQTDKYLKKSTLFKCQQNRDVIFYN